MAKILKSSYFFPFQVTVDDREPDCVVEELKEFGNMIIQRKRLDVGDYLLDDNLLVERKTIYDFCHSIKDGRLFKQVARLAKNPIQACIILEGKNKTFKETKFSPQAIQGVLLSISLAFKVPVLRTKSPKETVQVMIQSFKQLTKDPLEDQRIHPRPFFFKKRIDPLLLARKIHILEGFPGIGIDRAEKLLLKFGNLQAIFNAGNEELLRVPGLGKKTIAIFRSILENKHRS